MFPFFYTDTTELHVDIAEPQVCRGFIGITKACKVQLGLPADRWQRAGEAGEINPPSAFQRLEIMMKKTKHNQFKRW